MPDGNADKINEFLERMEEEGTKEIQGVSVFRCDSVADALHLKAEMAQRRIKVDLVAYRALICCLCRTEERNK
ncbi:hypothetical protein SCA6_017729 [Theobroma cacao]